MSRIVLRIAILIIAALFCCSCGKAPLDPQIPHGLLVKCRDFLAFCIFLADQEKPYYNQIAQRYYYAMLALASISYQWNKGHGIEYKVVKHDEVWRLMPHDVKMTYGVELKSLRTRCDYYYDETARDLDGFRDELSAVLAKKDKVFPQLENKVHKDYTKFIEKGDTKESIKEADLDILMEKIKVLHDDLAAKLNITNEIMDA